MPLDIFTKYGEEFETLVRTAWRAYTGIFVESESSPGYSRGLSEAIRVIPKTALRRGVEEEDLRQQLSLFWILYHDQFRKNRPRSRLRSYLLRRSIWGLRDWLRENDLLRPSDDSLGSTEGRQETPEVNFSWILETDLPLTAWEKYLVYLKYAQEKSINEIAQILQKDRKTIRTRLEEIHEHIRRSYEWYPQERSV